jgi:hypothetical protein
VSHARTLVHLRPDISGTTPTRTLQSDEEGQKESQQGYQRGFQGGSGQDTYDSQRNAVLSDADALLACFGASHSSHDCVMINGNDHFLHALLAAKRQKTKD